jgi:hypothetical protein
MELTCSISSRLTQHQIQDSSITVPDLKQCTREGGLSNQGSLGHWHKSNERKDGKKQLKNTKIESLHNAGA